jgi:hypothetical protein
MKAIKLIVLALISFAAAGSAAKADYLIDSYIAQISEADKYNSNGQRLTSPAAILRQDRANFHAFGIRDAFDEGDCHFGSKSNREALENLLENGCASSGFVAALRYGNPLALVEIYRSDYGYLYITVTLAH